MLVTQLARFIMENDRLYGGKKRLHFSATANNAMNADKMKQPAFVVLLHFAGYGER
jgi:hypothetical protein